MTTLDQVHLLEEKVESAVKKMQQLQAENDALRKKCDELTNALSSQTEQLSSFSTDKNEIEDGLKKALDRLSFIENTVISVASKKPSDQVRSTPTPTASVAPSKSVVQPVVEKKSAPQSIQITPGVSKINEEELHKVQRINSVNRTPNTMETNNENVNISRANLNNTSVTYQKTAVPPKETFIAGEETVQPLNFDTMEDADGYQPAPNDEVYEFEGEESFDDMGIENAFDIFEETPSQGPATKDKEIIF